MSVSVSVNLRGVYGTYSLLHGPHNGRLEISLKHKLIKQFCTPQGLAFGAATIINLGRRESFSFPPDVLRHPSLCKFHVRNSITQSALSQLPLMGVIDQLAERMVATAATLDGQAAEVRRDYTDHGYLLVAEIEMVTLIHVIVQENCFLDTEVELHDEQVIINATSGPRSSSSSTEAAPRRRRRQLLPIEDEDTSIIHGTETELLDEQVIISTTRGPRSSSSTEAAARRRRRQRGRRHLLPIGKLRKTEHEMVEVGSDELNECGCSICLEVNLGDTLVRFGCKHVYHTTCILKWLDKHDSCPLCRRQLFRLDD